jgi:Protein of unknown function (DUF1761)
MDILNHLGEVNWIAVVVATIAAFLLGGAWYSQKMFGTKWMQEIGLTEESIDQTHMARTFGTTFVLQFVAATALAVFLGSDSSWTSGLHSGALIGLLWIATAYGITYLFEQRSMRLFLINAGYYVVLFSIMGAILGGWH